MPARARSGAGRRARRASAPRDVDGDRRRRRRSPGALALAYAREPRIAAREPHPVARRRRRRTSDEHDLYDLAKAIDWKRLFAATRTLRVDVAATRSPLQSLEFATLAREGRGMRPLPRRRQRAAVGRQARCPTCASTPTSPSATRRSTSTRRASRCSSAAIGATPTRRRCARTSRRDCWRCRDGHRITPLLDPMCGSGTIVVEAALIAADRAPGLARTFGFQKLAWFDGPVVAAHEASGARPRSRSRRRHR